MVLAVVIGGCAIGLLFSRRFNWGLLFAGLAVVAISVNVYRSHNYGVGHFGSGFGTAVVAGTIAALLGVAGLLGVGRVRSSGSGDVM